MNSVGNDETWLNQKNKLKQKIFALIGNDLMFEESRRDEVLEKLQVKLGKSKVEVNKILDAL